MDTSYALSTAKRLYCIRTFLLEMTWRGSVLSAHMLQLLQPWLAHSYKQVRGDIAALLNTCFLCASRLQTFFPPTSFRCSCVSCFYLISPTFVMYVSVLMRYRRLPWRLLILTCLSFSNLSMPPLGLAPPPVLREFVAAVAVRAREMEDNFAAQSDDMIKQRSSYVLRSLFLPLVCLQLFVASAMRCSYPVSDYRAAGAIRSFRGRSQCSACRRRPPSGRSSPTLSRSSSPCKTTPTRTSPRPPKPLWRWPHRPSSLPKRQADPISRFVC